MKIWILHDSQYGNGKKIAETMKETFSNEADVEIGHVKEIDPEQVFKEKPDMLIVGTAIRAFTTSLASKNWIRKFKRLVRTANEKVLVGAVFVTHGLPKKWMKFQGNRFYRIFKRGNIFNKVYQEWLSGRVEEVEGPLVEGTIEKTKQTAKELLELSKKS
ncbi:MAG: flavodoxin family protein [Promethearchaeota archaeon]|nr:MAG: flavodoxin family protein [Candidatus Lokiarchaeota archaeon]